MKYLTILLLLGTTLSFAAEHAESQTEISTEATTAIGIHGMAVFRYQDKFYASHMPLANSMHAHQYIFSFKSDEETMVKLTELTDQFSLVSIQPEVFDLMELMKGELTKFKADIYANHFEREGQLKTTGAVIEVSEVVLSKPLSAEKNGDFFFVPLSDNEGLLVHQIGKNPSFDQIIAYEAQNQSNAAKVVSILEGITSGKPLDISTAQVEGLHLSTQIYLETLDFQ